jgi:hypothetical protein
LFAIYIDDIVGLVNNSGLGCKIGIKHFAIILYADDILLLAPSLDSLQRLFNIVERALIDPNMALNVNKSFCLRFGPRFKVPCSNLTSLFGQEINWVSSFRYLGVYFTASRYFKCDFTFAKRAFFRSVNSVFGKVLRVASEEVVLELVRSKCLPILMYGLDVCPVNTGDYRSFDFIQSRTIMKLFRTFSLDVVNDCRIMFNLKLFSEVILNRKLKFLSKLSAVESDTLLSKFLFDVASTELRTLHD